MVQNILGELPPELLDLVLEKVPINDQLSLRQTCSQLHAYLSPMLFKTVQVDLKLEPHRNRLVAASAGTLAIAQYIRTLELYFPPPDHIGEYGGDVMALHFVGFLRKLRNLQNFSWEYCSTDVEHPDVFAEGVMTALAAIPTIQNHELVLHITKDDPPVSGLKNLTSLQVLMHTELTYTVKSFSLINLVVAASPELKELIIENASYDHFNIKIGAWLEGVGTPPLEHLELYSVAIPMPLTSGFRHILSNLKRLTLDASPVRDIAWETIWNALHDTGSTEGVHLETLVVPGAQGPTGMGALFNYLVFHPGLKGLTIQAPPHDLYGHDEFYSERIQNKQLATKFWNEVLPRHAHSLRELRIITLWSGPWCYGPDASAVIRQCTRLQKLELTVSDVNEQWAFGKAVGLDPKPASDLPLPPPPENNYTEYYYVHPTETPSWGKIHTMPILLCTDLAFLQDLEQVDVELGPQVDVNQNVVSNRVRIKSAVRYGATELLHRFVARNDPHCERFRARDGIMRICPFLKS